MKTDFVKFSFQISKSLKRSQEKFVLQMLYGIREDNKLHLSETARFLRENISFKKTIEYLSRNLHAFDRRDIIMQNYLSLVKQRVKEDYAMIVIDNSDIAKLAAEKMEALSDIRDGSTGEMARDHFTIEAAVLSKEGNMPLPVYKSFFCRRKRICQRNL